MCALAFVRSVGVGAIRPVPTRSRNDALVHILHAEPARISNTTGTRKIQVIPARRTPGVVLARVRGARVQLVLAVSARKWQFANALVVVDLVDARAAVLTRIGGAVVDVCLTVGSGVSWKALADVGSEVVSARASVLARVRRALVDVILALLSTVS